MSKPFRGMSEPQMTHLRNDIVLIEYSDPGAEEIHLSTNTYVLLNAGRMLLVDTNVSPLLPFIRQLSDDGFSPAALVITHRHVVGLGDALSDLKTEFKIPLLLHPIDANHKQAASTGIPFENPIGHRVLREFGFDALLFPGQTAGSIMLYSTNNGGLLLTGDSATGTSADQAKGGLERLVRPPIETSVDDAELRRQWISFDRPVATVLPFHGTGYVIRSAADLVNKRHLLVCNRCCWCLSYLPDLENDTIEYFDNCPMCNEEIESMFISENASKRLDSKHIQNTMTQFENWVV